MDILRQLNSNLFVSTTNLLKENNIPFWVDTKALRSLMGKKIGIDLPTEKNIRISIPGEHFQKLLSLHDFTRETILSILSIFLNIVCIESNFENFSISLEKEIGLMYRFQFIPDRSGRQWIENDYCRLAVLSQWKHKLKANKIFITPKYKVGNTYRWVDKRSCKEIDCSYFDSLSDISIDVRSFTVPHKTEEYLKVRFGDNWKDPELKFCRSGAAPAGSGYQMCRVCRKSPRKASFLVKLSKT